MNKTTKTRMLMENFTNYFSGNTKVVKEDINRYKYVISGIAVAIRNKYGDADFYPASEELIFITDGKYLYLNDKRRNIRTHNPDPYSEYAPDDSPRYRGKIIEGDLVDAMINDKSTTYRKLIGYIMDNGNVANEYILRDVIK